MISFINASYDGRKLPAADCQVTSFQALCIAFRHPALTSDPKVVCSLLQCCKSWQAALQQCGAGNTVINVQKLPSLFSITAFACFVAWMSQHRALVAEIHLQAPLEEDTREGVPASIYCKNSEQVLALGLSIAAAAAAAPAASQPTDPAAAVATFGLKHFSTEYVSNPTLLQALPAVSLTKLTINVTNDILNFRHSLNAAALTRLTCLRELSLLGFISGGMLQGSCVEAVSNLSHLTNLKMGWLMGECCNIQLLPQQLQQLQLDVHNSSLIQLGHITALRELQLLSSGSVAPGSTLPAQLTALTFQLLGDAAAALGDSASHLGISSLLQLQRLKAIDCLEQPLQLQQLTALSQLQHVELEYCTAGNMLSAAPAWKHLPQLCSLQLGSYPPLDRGNSLAVLRGLAAATTLTALTISSEVFPEMVEKCACLTCLSQLQQLSLIEVALPSREDALLLTALTNLTKLELSRIDVVDDTVAVALALKLTRLQHLALLYCKLSSSAALPAIAGMRSLRVLELLGYFDEIADNDVLLLTELRNLQELHCCHTFSFAAEARFWARVRGTGQQPAEQQGL